MAKNYPYCLDRNGNHDSGNLGSYHLVYLVVNTLKGGKSMNLEQLSTRDLINELLKRKEVQNFHGGNYQSVELIGKYDHRNIELPASYEIILFDQLQKSHKHL